MVHLQSMVEWLCKNNHVPRTSLDGYSDAKTRHANKQQTVIAMVCE